MKTMIRNALMSVAFAAGAAIPLAATLPTPAQALTDCSLLSGSDSWTGRNADGSSFTVSVSHLTGVSLTGTAPPLASLPRVLTSTSGHMLTISATPTGARQYEGTFTGTTQETCNCPHFRCDSFTTGCVEQDFNWCQVTSETTCVYGGCGGGPGGGCTGGVCSGPKNFTARF